MDPADVARQIDDLQRRVAALEQVAHMGQALSLPSHSALHEAGAEVSPPSAFLPALGRGLLALAGAYLLRALVESDSIPTRAGVAIGILYAMMWLICAARTPAERRLEAAIHGLTAVLVLSPLLWEATLRFHAVGTWAAALTLLFFTLFGLAISWRKNLLIVATIATLAGLGTAAGLLVATHDVLPFTFVFLATAAAVEISACLEHWLSERWLAAAAADLAVLLATWLVTNPRGLPEVYAPIPHGWLVAAQVGLLAIYLASTIVRTLFRGFTFTAFETAQCIAAFAISVGGGLRLSPAMPIVAVGCGVACYIVAFALLARGRNFYTYSTFAILLVLAGSRIVLAGSTAAAVWSVLALACAWSGHLTLHVHGAVYLLLALAAAGDLAHSAGAVAVVAVCYLGARRGPLRIPLFIVWIWVFAGFAGGLAPAALRLAVKLLIYGAALIVLPRLKANPAAAPADSGTTPHPRDSEARSGTASGAA